MKLTEFNETVAVAPVYGVLAATVSLMPSPATVGVNDCTAKVTDGTTCGTVWLREVVVNDDSNSLTRGGADQEKSG